MVDSTTRALISRMAAQLDHYRQLLIDNRRETHALATEARALLDAEPQGEGLTDEELDALERRHWQATGVVSEGLQKEELFNYRAFARAVESAALARWGRSVAPPAEGEVGR